MPTTHTSSRNTTLGIACGIMAAICYGTNPLGAVKLYANGLDTGSVLFYRFGIALLIMTLIVTLRGESLRLSLRQLMIVTFLGVMFSLSSLSLYLSFHFMAAGIASTLLFVYPIMTAVIMTVFFRERLRWNTVIAIVLSLAGVVALYSDDLGGTLSASGVALVMLSSLTYALYIIAVDKSNLSLSPYQTNLYVLFYCTLGAIIYCYASGHSLMLPPNGESWFYACWLAIVPAIMALVLMVFATRNVGSTATAITGAFEPLTAVAIGVIALDEPFSPSLAIGIALILAAVIVIALKK